MMHAGNEPLRPTGEGQRASPLLSLSPVTAGVSDFRVGCEVAGKGGFDGISVRYDQLQAYLANGNTIDDALKVVQDNGLIVNEIGFLAEWMFHGGIPIISRRSRMQSDDDVRRLRGDVDRFFDQAAALGAGVVTAAGTLLDIGTEETAVADLDSLGRWAGGYGLNISFEFFGHAKSYSTLREAIGLLSAVRAPNTGITLDTFLFHQGGSSISDISNLAGPADRLLSVQVADSSPGSIATLDTLKGRRLPGQGVIQLQDILNAVVAAGYRGYFVVEVFNDPLSPADALRCARSVRESMLDILGSINGSADIDPA